jgi:hypothetical protein
LAELDNILAEEFTLTHMTGYVQSKSEWLDAIDTGEMQYHRMETVEAALGMDRHRAGADRKHSYGRHDLGLQGHLAPGVALLVRTPRGDGWVICTHGRINLVSRRGRFPLNSNKYPPPGTA